MKIKLIAMSVLATVLSTSAVFADDMQQGSQMGGMQANPSMTGQQPAAGTTMPAQPATEAAMPGQQGAADASQMPQPGTADQATVKKDAAGNPVMPAGTPNANEATGAASGSDANHASPVDASAQTQHGSH